MLCKTLTHSIEYFSFMEMLSKHGVQQIDGRYYLVQVLFKITLNHNGFIIHAARVNHEFHRSFGTPWSEWMDISKILYSTHLSF